MPRLLADVNVDRHLRAILSVARSDQWREVWNALAVEVLWFPDLGIAPDAPDDYVWRLCQEREILLLTGNRNDEGDTSLEATIRRDGSVGSFPVLTLADANRVLTDRTYLEGVTVRLMEILMELDRVRGSGRLFLP